MTTDTSFALSAWGLCLLASKTIFSFWTILFNSLKAGLNLSICPTCRRQLPILEAFIKDLASSSVAAIGFSIRTLTPALRQSRPTLWWRSVGTAIQIASTLEIRSW